MAVAPGSGARGAAQLQIAMRVSAGVKGSGYGRFGGKASIAEFTDCAG
ncbi:hypothetical protein [Mesorhizobium sp. B2-4-13]|nr:hypothetical protein [Mesorhizobium sp. B2-4-13]